MRLLKVVSICCFIAVLEMVGLRNLALAQDKTGNAMTGVTLTSKQLNNIQQLENWIDNLTIMKANFQQIAPNGQRSTGQVWIKRPGRIRFEYDKPSQLLLVANEGKMVFHDGAVGQTTTIPIDQNPLGLLLKPDLHFSGDVTIVKYEKENGLIQVKVVRTASPSEGSLTLIFNQNYMVLRGWEVVDAQGQVTKVDLYDLHPKKSVSDELFNIHFKDDE